MKPFESVVQAVHMPFSSRALDIIGPEEWAAVVVFLAAILIISLYSLRAHFRLLRSGGNLGVLGRIEIVMLMLSVFGAACLCYGYFVEPYSLEIDSMTISTAKLPRGSHPVRAVLISDLHCDPQPRTEEKIPSAIASLKPDVIFFAGDAINSPQALSIFQKLALSLSQIAPTYAVRGNHDVRQWRYIDLYKSTGVHELNGQAVKLPFAGGKIWISGVAVDAESRLDKAISAMPEDAFTIFLYHFPAEVFNIASKKVDLFCTGHTHGGQVRLPFYGALVTRSRVGKRFEAGCYKVDDTWVYVSRGIGMEGGICPRVRFLAKPEITVINIVPKTITANTPNAKPI